MSAIPIEVKAGKTGTLRSLHTFIDQEPSTPLAIRLYAGFICKEDLRTPQGHPYYLLNLPYYLSGQLAHFL